VRERPCGCAGDRGEVDGGRHECESGQNEGEGGQAMNVRRVKSQDKNRPCTSDEVSTMCMRRGGSTRATRRRAMRHK
jgi:hypothetical protein